MDIESAKKQYRTVGFTVFIISIALLVMRIVSYYVQIALIDSMDSVWMELLIDALFSVPVQIGILFVFPFLMYKFRLKKSAIGVFEFSNYRKCNIWVCLLSVLLGGVIIFVTVGVSFFWQIFITLFGYKPSSGGDLPATFNAGYFIITVLLTAVLPGICEEFANRGGLLTVMRSAFSKKMTILYIAIAFGLFHQNIAQIFYTALLGALLAYLVLETGSVLPAIIVHFMNNFMSLYIDNATTYNWTLLGGFYDFVNGNIQNGSMEVLSAAYALCVLAAFGLVVAITAISRKNRQKDLLLELNTEYAKAGYKVELKDNIFFIGAIVVTAVATVITFLSRV